MRPGQCLHSILFAGAGAGEVILLACVSADRLIDGSETVANQQFCKALGDTRTDRDTLPDHRGIDLDEGCACADARIGILGSKNTANPDQGHGAAGLLVEDPERAFCPGPERCAGEAADV